MNVPAEKAMNFGGSAKRLLGTLRPERFWLVLVLAMAVAGVVLQVIGPRLLGEGIALLDDRDLARVADSGVSLQRIKGDEIQDRFRFVKEPKPT